MSSFVITLLFIQIYNSLVWAYSLFVINLPVLSCVGGLFVFPVPNYRLVWLFRSLKKACTEGMVICNEQLQRLFILLSLRSTH